MASRAARLLPVVLGCGALAALAVVLGPRLLPSTDRTIVAELVRDAAASSSGADATRRERAEGDAARDAQDAAGDARDAATDGGDAWDATPAAPEVEIAIAADAAVMGVEGPFRSITRYCAAYQHDHVWKPDMAAGACGGGPARCDPEPPLDPPPPAPWRSARLVDLGPNGDLLGWWLAAETARGVYLVDLSLVTHRCDDSVSVGQSGGFALSEGVHVSAHTPDGGEPEIVVRSVERVYAVHPLDPAYDNDASDQLRSCEVVCRASDGGPECRTGCSHPVDTR